jgi:hypothetical protein
MPRVRAVIPAHLADAAAHDAIGRRAKHRLCGQCQAVVLVGLDADRCAGEAHTDPDPITGIGEVLALLAGRATYRLRRAGRLQLDHRTRWHIAGEPADHVDVVAEHRCGAPPLPTKPKPPTRLEEHHDRPPY